MKTLLTLFFFNLSFSIFHCSAQWVELNPGVDVPYFSDIYAITPDIVVVAGANGTILKTTDGGETWVQKPSGTTSGLGKVQFPTPNIGYITTGGGTLLKTTDGGETWATIDTGQTTSFYGLSCVDENTIFISNNDTLLKSEDGGNIWSSIHTGINIYGRNFQFFNSEIGYIPNESGGISKTVNGGGSWQDLLGLSPFYFINENIGFYYEGGLLKTVDGGNNFQYIGFGTGEYLSTILAINENTVWGIFEGLLDGDGTTRGVIKITDNGSYVEDIEYDNSTIDMSSIHFANETTGYITGIKNGIGTIWKNGTGINTMSTNEQERNNEIKFYPNPVSNELNIVLDKPTKTKISLIDITGKQVYSRSFQENQVKINTSEFPKGTYILSVKTENKNFTKKIIIN